MGENLMEQSQRKSQNFHLCDVIFSQGFVVKQCKSATWANLSQPQKSTLPVSDLLHEFYNTHSADVILRLMWPKIFPFIKPTW